MHGEGLSLHPATARVRSEVVQVANMLPAALTYWLKKKKKKEKDLLPVAASDAGGFDPASRTGGFGPSIDSNGLSFLCHGLAPPALRS